MVALAIGDNAKAVAIDMPVDLEI